MVTINFPTDGQGTQALQKKNKAKSIAHIDAVTPDPESQKDSNKQKSPPEHKQARGKLTDNNSPESAPDTDRRKANRRKKKESVLLNTRSEQDRRTNSVQPDPESNSSDTTFGIDTKA